jgi:hypothetical protein
LRTNLKTGINKTIRAREPDLKSNNEIRVVARAREKHILFHLGVDIATRKATAFHTPMIGVTFPTVHRLPVEQRRSFSGRRRSRECQQWENKRGQYQS